MTEGGRPRRSHRRPPSGTQGDFEAFRLSLPPAAPPPTVALPPPSARRLLGANAKKQEQQKRNLENKIQPAGNTTVIAIFWPRICDR